MHFSVDEATILNNLLEILLAKKEFVNYEEVEQGLGIKTYQLHKLLEKLNAINQNHSFEILEIRDHFEWFKINENTEAFLKNGGFVQYIEDNIKQQELEKEQKELQFKKLKLDVRNSERIHKTYWYTFSFSVIALIISLILLVIKLFFEKS